MLDKLRSVLSQLPALLDDPSLWQSLLINKRKPFTYRVWTSYQRPVAEYFASR